MHIVSNFMKLFPLILLSFILFFSLAFTTGCNCSGSTRSDASQLDVDGDVGDLSKPLPEKCQYNDELTDDCNDTPDLPRAVACHGSPVEMITVLNCEYKVSKIGYGNVYCCP